MNKLALGSAVAAVLAIGLYQQGLLPFSASPSGHASPSETVAKKAKSSAREEPAPAVTVVRAVKAPLRETILVTGTLVPRLEVLVAPEVEGLRVVELLVEEGAKVAKGQLLARLEQETLRAQLAQNDASRAKSAATITQAQSNIVAAEARRVETSNALDRARPLSKSGVLADSTLDQREAAFRTAVAQLRVAEDGLKVAEAESAQVEAQRRDITWRLSRTDVRAPVDGIVSRRNARLGAVASGAAVAQPMFSMISEGQIELEAEVPETDMARLRQGQKAAISVAGVPDAEGIVRLVMPEVDRATRQGRVRISLSGSTVVRIGSFGRGTVLVRDGDALVLPASAVLFGAEGAYVQIVVDNRVVSRKVATGLHTAELIEIKSGLSAADDVVAKAGTFLRAGDLVTSIPIKNSSPRTN